MRTRGHQQELGAPIKVAVTLRSYRRGDDLACSFGRLSGGSSQPSEEKGKSRATQSGSQVKEVGGSQH